MKHYPVWHPYTQMQTAEQPIPIVRAEGAVLYGEKGETYIDAVASWWTNIHGHAHPYIAQKIAEQATQLEQVIFAGFTHRPAVQLAEELLKYIPYHQYVFYSDNGSTAVECAIKMALQFYANKGEGSRTRLIAFKEAYHGDTFGSMSVSARNVFTHPFQPLLFDVCFIDTPNGSNETAVVNQLQQLLAEKGDSIAAFIFEPLVLGSAGMKMYPPSTLEKLMAACHEKGILCIADEVMTGFGRTGKFFATDFVTQKPDIICLSKGITGGFLPFAATTCTARVYEAFLSNEKAKMLFHGHSYTANPLGCAAALASLHLFETEDTFGHIQRIEELHQSFKETICGHPSLADVRHRGTILALELKSTESTGYLNTLRDEAYRFFIQHGILVRPLGNVLYLLPPYCIANGQLQYIYQTISRFLDLQQGKNTPSHPVDFT